MAIRNELKERTLRFIHQVEKGCNKPICFNYYCKKNPDHCPLTKPEALRLFMEFTKNQTRITYCVDDCEQVNYETLNLKYSKQENLSNLEIIEYSKILPNIEIASCLFGCDDDNENIDYSRINYISTQINSLEKADRDLFFSQLNANLGKQSENQTNMMQIELDRQQSNSNRIIEECEEKEDPKLNETLCDKRFNVLGLFMVKLISHDFLFESDALILQEQLPNFCLNQYQYLQTSKTAYQLERLNSLPKKIQDIILENFHNDLAILLINMESEGMDNNKLSQWKSIQIIMDLLYKSNKLKQRIKKTDFVNESCSTEIDLGKATERWFKKNKLKDNTFTPLDYPWLFSLESKVDILTIESKLNQNAEITSSLNNLNIFNMMNMGNQYLTVTVRRSNQIEDALNQLSNQTKNQKKPLRVVFYGEPGVDEGGPRKEFFFLVIQKLFDPNFGMFTVKNERFLWFNSNSFECRLNFELIGTILGLAIYNSDLQELKFPNVVYKKLLCEKHTLEDLKEFEPELFTSMNNQMNMTNDLSDMGLTFSVTYDNFGAAIVKELKDNGSNIDVTQDNKQEFLDLYLDWYFNDSIAQQYEPFYKGFTKTLSEEARNLFEWEELYYVQCGKPELDFIEQEKTTRYEGFNKDTPLMKNFWEIIHSFDDQKKRQFLLFTTGSDRSPLKGLGQLNLVILKHGEDSERLPSAHTCFNHLLIPCYSSKEKLYNKLVNAINNCEGFGMI